MAPQDRTKVCLSCEADVNLEATYCPFCGADLSTAPVESASAFSPSPDERFEAQPLKESLASLYKPPYSVRNRRGLGVPDERVETTFTRAEPAKEDPLSYYEQGKVGKKVEEKVEVVEQERQIGGVLPLVLLLIGTVFLVLAIALFFFSSNGVLTLEWKSSYWFLYALLSLPFLFLAIRLLKKL